MIFQTSLGIDIQEHAVFMVSLKAAYGGIRVAAHARYELEGEGFGREKAVRVGEAIRNFLGKKRVTAENVFVGIPRGKVVLRYLSLPLAVKENLKASLGYQIDKHVPFAGDEIYFDCQILEEDKKDASLKLFFVAAKRDVVDPFIAELGQAGLGLSGLEISSTALTNFFASLPDGNREGSPLVILSGKDTWEVNLLEAGQLHSSRWFDVKDPLGLSYEILQELKRLDEIASPREGPLQAVFCGAQAFLALEDQVKDMEGVAVRKTDLSEKGLPSEEWIPAYGLALKGIRKTGTNINLLPEDLRKKASKAGSYVLFVLAGLLVVLAMGWAGGNIYHHQSYLRHLDREISVLSDEIKKIGQLRTQSEDLEKRLTFLLSIPGERLTVLESVRELSERVPKTAWVQRFMYSKKSREIQIEGWAQSASELIPILEQSSLFEDVAFRSSITRNPAGNERFLIGLKVN